MPAPADVVTRLQIGPQGESVPAVARFLTLSGAVPAISLAWNAGRAPR